MPENSTFSCETCLYYDYDDAWQEEVCTLDLDEDEVARLDASKSGACPYYRFYDEYKLVQKQN